MDVLRGLCRLRSRGDGARTRFVPQVARIATDPHMTRRLDTRWTRRPRRSRSPVQAAGSARPQQSSWHGWGTALKPAHEPIILARKPLIGTVAANVLEHGTGALNVDGCRVATDDMLSFGSRELGDGIKYGKCTPTTEGVKISGAASPPTSSTTAATKRPRAWVTRAGFFSAAKSAIMRHG